MRVACHLDFINAYNTLDRRVVLDEVAKHIPSLLPFVRRFFCRAGRLVFTGNGSGPRPSRTFRSMTGVRQGDPLGEGWPGAQTLRLAARKRGPF